MKATYRHFLIVVFLFCISMLAMDIPIKNNKHFSSKSKMLFKVTLGKHQYSSTEPITIEVSLTNLFDTKIGIDRTSFGLAPHRGDDGFFINDDKIRSKCGTQFALWGSGSNYVSLNPGEAISEEIIIPIEANFSPGVHEISYGIKIPFYGNEKQFDLMPGQTRRIYFDQKDRPTIDAWIDRFHDFVNRNGVFTLKGKLNFTVKQ